ncbi:MAG: NAD(P)/FAD-dependent oxidoreductase [Propionicimonas sp.]|uniref:dihydrolipoyl dehydrogenase family protein n=1 Tax=Propionicimonas sp. TaxID=1955623 RepID=UPI001D74DD44|nr:NAD(P)/FAD-dependent oxidoreductase [Propionicimonas sp.]MBU4186592.1 NAD(P)/FAD-dependent oxidoreductase [Actinomycetota bacterium]MBU4205467.1 NAD(P)/FAD-dependent oxidoreductase [Actinomycetota bacterium]MBU4248738.1 NAD(P)/FAD-dependent oxidoreductase [Actinomycetota bacterium]MBU4365279.1 NAD(P)/FAD-dependent oxidoreductase [Actinomycetota bacterium]MBU4411167.1 NAD(P)/FAD-dependent oxidoreductase [Actinomycetota bacterium]
MQTFDVAVIGLGPGGEHVAGTLAESGLRVLGIERELVGGECPYWGCVPTKMMVRASDALAEAHRVPALAGHLDQVRPDWALVAARISDEATDAWDDTVAARRFTDKGGVLVRGSGKVISDTEVEVDGTSYRVRRGIVVATGSKAAIPPIPGLADVDYWTNREVVSATTLPQSMVVLGGGAIGCELSQVLARFGVRVILVEAAPRLLALEEPEASAALQGVLEAEGVEVHLGLGAEQVEAAGTGVTVRLADGTSVSAERILVATGRRADPAAVGLTAVGVDPAARVAPTDHRCRVSEGVWAVGDLTGKGAFTHVAMYQAGIVIRDLLGEPGPPAAYHALPRVTFTDPEIGAVGLTEAQAREQLTKVSVGATPLSATTRGWIHKVGNEGFIKLVADAERDVLVGATVMAPAGGEVLGALAVAVHARVPLAELRSMIYAYPTFHRGIEEALGKLH